MSDNAPYQNVKAAVLKTCHVWANSMLYLCIMHCHMGREELTASVAKVFVVVLLGQVKCACSVSHSTWPVFTWEPATNHNIAQCGVFVTELLTADEFYQLRRRF